MCLGKNGRMQQNGVRRLSKKLWLLCRSCAFANKEKHQRGLLGTQELVMALMDSGTLPTVGRLHTTTVSNFATRINKLAVYRFSEFLEQVDSLRREERSQREAAFRSWYTIHKWQDDKAIATTDMPQLIMDLSLVADSCRSVLDVRALVEDCHKNGAESLPLGFQWRSFRPFLIYIARSYVFHTSRV